MNNQYDTEALLYQNHFIEPEDLEDLTPEERDLFVRNYQKKIDEQNIQKNKQIEDIQLPEKIETYRRSVILIDSEFRNKKIYPKPNDFIYIFPRKYTNIARIKLLHTSISNTDSVIKDQPASSRNNRIYWINEEDIDLDYPIYTVALRPGSYTALTIVNEIVDKMNYVRRRGGNDSFHSFNVSIDLDTDICTFTSLINTNLSINALSVIDGSGQIDVSHPNHGFFTGQIIYFSGIQTFAGISSDALNNNYAINVVDVDHYYYTVNQPAIQTITGGGNTIVAGKESSFKLLWGDYSDTPQFNLGFSIENSSISLSNNNALTTYTFGIEDIVPGTQALFTSTNHRLLVGDVIQISNLNCFPDISKRNLRITSVPNSNQFTVNTNIISFDNSSLISTVVNTNIVNFYFPNHGFNSLVAIQNAGSNILQLTSFLPHGLTSGDQIWISNTDSIPSINGYYTITVVDTTNFNITFGGGVSLPGTYGFIGNNQIIDFYNVQGYQDGTIGGISPDSFINGIDLSIRKIVDSDNFNFIVPGAFASFTQPGGGSEIRFSSYKHGFAGSQTNQTSETVLNRPISLQGVDYIYLCSPQMDDMIENNANIKDAFAIIKLTGPPGTVIYDSFVDNPKVYDDSPLTTLEKMQFIVRNPDGTLYDFNGIDYNFSLEIIEVIDRFKNSNVSSQRNATYDYDLLRSQLERKFM